MFGRFLRVVLVLGVLVLPACGDEVASPCTGTDVRLVSSGHLTIAADYNYPPFAYRSPKNELIGFEVELGKHIAKQLKLEAVFVNRGAGAMVTGLLSHRHDLALSGLRASEALAEQTCLSDPFLSADLGVLVSSGSQIDKARALRGKTVAVLDDSAAERYALDELGRSEIASLPTTDDLLTALQQGRVDAVVADLPFVRFSATTSRAFAEAARIPLSQDYVAAGAKDNGPLMRGVDDALARLEKAGTITKLKQKFFGG